MTGSAMKPHLTTSARPATRSASGRVASTSTSQSTPAGGWKAPTRFLPSAVLMPVLPPTAASTMPSSVVGTWTTRTPAQPRRRDEAGEVGDRAAADPDDGIGAGEAGAAELRPERRRDLGRLGRLGIGHLGDVDGIPPLASARGDPGGERRERRRVDDEHALDVARRAGRRPGRARRTR